MAQDYSKNSASLGYNYSLVEMFKTDNDKIA